MCLAIALSIQDTASLSTGLPSSSVTAAARPVVNSAGDSCTCQYLSEQEGFSQTVDRAETSAACSGPSNSAHRLVSHGASHCSSRHEYDFPRSLVAGDANIESVFEPRPPHPLSSPQLTRTGPPHPLSSPQPARTGKRCALAHDETVTVLDPWRRRPSSLDHGRHKSHCSHPTDSYVVTSKKCKSSSRRRRSCGSHLPHRNPPDVGYLSDRTISPVPNSTERVTSVGRAPVSRDLQTPADSLDLVISSDILESMLQGAEGYCASGETVGQPEPAVRSDDNSTRQADSRDDCDSVFL